MARKGMAGRPYVMLHLPKKHTDYLSEWLIIMCKMERIGGWGKAPLERTALKR